MAILQVALDFLELNRALKLAHEAVQGGADWIEAGTPLIKSEGLDSIRALRKEFPKHYIIADLKTMDAGRAEVESSAKAGANCAIVLGVSSKSTILECIEVSKNYGIDIGVDLLNVQDFVELSKKCQEWGAHHVGLHLPIDDQMRGMDPLAQLKKLRPAVSVPIAVAGGINSETAALVVQDGADVVIVGGAITKAENAEEATRQIRRSMQTMVPRATSLFKRASTDAELRKVFQMVSTPNISDALHRTGEISGLVQITQGVKLVGKAFTVRTYPGDWAKPVEAIDMAQPFDVIVVDAGGVPPAVWGELATHSSIQKNLSGIVIDGAIRDVDSIRQLSFPAFARHVTPTAGEPKGFGETGIAIRVGNALVSPGDWIVGDESGLTIVPKAKAVEVANRAMDVYEKENRIREEIKRKSSLAEVSELVKWEKQIVEDIKKK